MICSKCGMEFEEGIFCPICGFKNLETKIEVSDNMAAFGHQNTFYNGVIPDVLEKPRKSYKKPFIICGIILGILLIIVSALLIYIFTKPHMVKDTFVDSKIFFLDKDGNYYLFEDGEITDKSTALTKETPEGATILSESKIKNLIVYSIIKDGGYEIHRIFNNQDDVISKDNEKIVKVKCSDDGAYFAYSVCHKETREEKVRNSSTETQLVDYYIYDLYKVNSNGENVRLDTQEYLLEPRLMTDEGILLYYAQKDEKIRVVGNGYSSNIAENAVRMVYYKNTGDYIYENSNKEIKIGNLNNKSLNDEELITTEIDALYDIGNNQSDEEVRGCDCTIIDGFCVSKSYNPSVFYVKNSTLYYKELAKTGDSVKIANILNTISNISFQSDNIIYYLDGSKLCKAVNENENWTNQVIKDDVEKYALLPYGDELLYVSSNALKSINDENTVISDNINSESDIYITKNFVIYNDKNGETIIYNRDNSEKTILKACIDKAWIELSKKENIYYE